MDLCVRTQLCACFHAEADASYAISGDRIDAVTRTLHRLSPSPWLLTFTALARHKVCGRLSTFSSSRAAAAIRHNGRDRQWLVHHHEGHGPVRKAMEG